jgi:DNA repair exonuclease SbcCD ATPase subunit
MKNLTKGIAIKDETAELKRELAKLKRESNAKIKKFASQSMDQEKDIKGKEKEVLRLKTKFETSRKVFCQRETEVNQRREEIRYKNQQLASKDMEMESYRKVTEERIFQLEAKIKELEAKVKESSAPLQ